MQRNGMKVFILTVVVVFIAVGCTSSNPYIYKLNEFNRASKDFNRIPKDRKSIKICYSKFSTKLSDLQKMAQKECGLYGKIARFQEHDFLHFPLLTPTGATFICLKP